MLQVLKKLKVEREAGFWKLTSQFNSYPPQLWNPDLRWLPNARFFHIVRTSKIFLISLLTSSWTFLRSFTSTVTPRTSLFLTTTLLGWLTTSSTGEHSTNFWSSFCKTNVIKFFSPHSSKVKQTRFYFTLSIKLCTLMMWSLLLITTHSNLIFCNQTSFDISSLEIRLARLLIDASFIIFSLIRVEYTKGKEHFSKNILSF